MKKIFFTALIFPLVLFGQSPSQNFTKAKIYKNPSTSTITAEDTLVSINYYDGLNRPIQSVSVRAGGNKQDVVTPITYNEAGRQVRQYLPYADPTQTVSSLSYRDNTALISDLNSYYQAKYSDELLATAPNPYREIQIEESPLARIVRQAEPGRDWSLSSDAHTVKYTYSTNIATKTVDDNVFNFVVGFNNENTSDPSLSVGGYYWNSKLYKTVVKDENWVTADGNNKTTQIFKNCQGKTILERKFDAGIRHDTYYVYDKYSNLTYVIPPKASENLVTTAYDMNDNPTYIVSQDVLEKLCFIYKYDHRDRMVEKHIPDKGWEYMVYDKLNRIVLSQDQNLKLANKWLFTKYDAMDRVAYTGKFSSLDTRQSLQITINSNTSNLFEDRTLSSITLDNSTLYYTNSVFPTSNIELFGINYYDSYGFDMPNISVPAATTYHNLTTSTKSLATGSKIRIVVTGSIPVWITTVLGYDAKARIIWSKNNNPFMATTNTREINLNFVGDAKEIKTQHSRTGFTNLTVYDFYTYDHYGRILKHTHKINSGSVEILAWNKYDELGRCVQKKIGGVSSNDNYQMSNSLQEVDYTFNIRGWLTKINDPNAIGDDLFAFSIAYNTPSLGNALYNGNISQTSWKTAKDYNLRSYNYTYDNLNRIKTGIFKNATNSAQNDSFNLSGVTYDKNGNITFLHRAGDKLNDSSLAMMDYLHYTYQGNKLTHVEEDGNTLSGFKTSIASSNTSQQYFYDVNGNLVKDLNKGITNIDYNYHNLPEKITFTNKTIQYIYDALGNKLQKIYTNGGNITTTDYNNGFVYQRTNSGSNTLAYFPTDEGYVTKNGSGNFYYVYQFKDHLGNIRLSYTDYNNDGSVNANEIIEESNYDPFGMKHIGYNNDVKSFGSSVAQKKKFNSKEWQDEGDLLNWFDYGARNYDPALGRWMNPDPLAELYFSTSTYSYVLNNPIYFRDPDGRSAQGGGDPITWYIEMNEIRIEHNRSTGVTTWFIVPTQSYLGLSTGSSEVGFGNSGGGGGSPAYTFSDFWNSPFARLLIPDKISITISSSATAGIGISKELSLTWITRGHDATPIPYTAFTYGVQGGPTVSADALIGQSIGYYPISDMRMLPKGDAASMLYGHSKYVSFDLGEGVGGSGSVSWGVQNVGNIMPSGWITVGLGVGPSYGVGFQGGASFSVPLK
ncbi:MAG: RHS repeat-associated core domain-containing protein [Flavobacteriales bacterium]|nr:MAG: RHS repeat-associated core domain-containing protein [Flavobacteriales bacterium]